MKSIAEQIISHGIDQPEKIAVTDGKVSKTYGELTSNIFFAKEILEKKYGLKEGDAIVIAADKQPEFAALYFACHLVGVVTLPIAPDTNPKRFQMIKDRVKPKLIVGFEDKYNHTEVSFKDFEGESIIEEQIVPMGRVADVMFTTGTTGDPKGVQLSQQNIAAAARNINAFIGNTKEDVEMIALPISHSFGIGRMRCALSNGQTVVMIGTFANAKRFFRFMEEYHVTGFGMVPASWSLIKRLSGMKISDYKEQLRYIEIGSAPMDIEDKRILINALPNTRICMHYGLTEASRSAFMEFHESKDRLETIGKESPNMNITIKDENGEDIPNGEDGEICVSGDAVTIGYLDLPKESFFWGDYFRTGDWGTKDEEGFITLKSRKKELINVGGKKVSPIEVEDVLKSFDFVDDCACIAIPDPEGLLGEVVKAFIVTKEPDKVTKRFIDQLIGKDLESYKHPAIFEVINEIPRTSSGKVQRLMLK